MQYQLSTHAFLRITATSIIRSRLHYMYALFALIFHMFRCVLCPMSPDRFPVHMSTSIFETPLQDLSPKDSILNISGYNEGKQSSAQNMHGIGPSLPSRFHHVHASSDTKNEEGSDPYRSTSRVASVVQAIGISASPRQSFHSRMLCLICGERCRSRKRSHQLLCPTSYLERVYKKEPLNVHYPPSNLGEAIRKLSFCRR